MNNLSSGNFHTLWTSNQKNPSYKIFFISSKYLENNIIGKSKDFHQLF